MNKTIHVAGIEVEVESRYRIELNQWQASLRHPLHGFTVCEWATTAHEATRAAHRALLFYAREIEQVIGSNGKRATAP